MSACPECQTFKNEVLTVRKLRNGWVRRYRHCQNCDHRWITIELPLSVLDGDLDPEGMMELRSRAKTK